MSENAPSRKEHGQKERLFTVGTVVFLSLTIIVHFIFGIVALNKSLYVDEKLWTFGKEHRIEKYWENLREGDWRNTRPSDKPGISVALVSGPALLFVDPSEHRETHGDPEGLIGMLALMRLPLVLFGSLAILLFYITIARTVDRRTALLGSVMIGLSPILIGMSRIINPDALLWIFVPLTIISYFAALRTGEKKWVLFTGLMFGLALLTKYVANILLVFFVITLFTQMIATQKDKIHALLRDRLKILGLIVLIALATLIILYPGTWVKPDRILLATIWSQAFKPIWIPFVLLVGSILVDHFLNRSRILSLVIRWIDRYHTILVRTIVLLFSFFIIVTIANTFTHFSLVNFDAFLSSPKSATQSDEHGPLGLYLTGFYTLLFGTVPLVLIGIFYALFGMFSHAQERAAQHTLMWHSLLFIMLFYAGNTFSLVGPTVRYQIVLFPLIILIAAYGLNELVMHFSQKRRKYIYLGILCVLMVCGTHTLNKIAPHYLSYNSPLLPRDQIINPKDMGDGIYETAIYLNQLPQAQTLNIWSDRKMICTLFVGDCATVTDLEGFLEGGPTYDLYVISRGHRNKAVRLTSQRRSHLPDYPLRLDRLYGDTTEHMYEINPGGRAEAYVRVINANHIDVLER